MGKSGASSRSLGKARKEHTASTSKEEMGAGVYPQSPRESLVDSVPLPLISERKPRAMCDEAERKKIPKISTVQYGS